MGADTESDEFDQRGLPGTSSPYYNIEALFQLEVQTIQKAFFNLNALNVQSDSVRYCLAIPGYRGSNQCWLQFPTSIRGL